MASTTFTQSRPIYYDANPSPETMFHLPMSPSEPGKFDFYRVHLANHANHSDSTFSDNSDAPTLSAQSSSSAAPRWTPFADIVSSNPSVGTSSSSSSNTSSTGKSQRLFPHDSSFTSNATSETVEPASSLTNAVRNALSKGHITVDTSQLHRPISGATLSTKDLNLLSPQSM